MRISDWSSDVCSSDLQRCVDFIKGLSLVDCVSVVGLHLLVGLTHLLNDRVVALKLIHQEVLIIIQVEKSPDRPSNGGHRSEEHTSELQSLMRISYAVFCLKKKKHIINDKKQV